MVKRWFGHWSLVIGICLVIVSWLLVVGGVGWGEVPPQISFQGRLTRDGTPITDSTAVVISLYESSTGGTAIWSSSQTVTPDLNGFFSVELEGGSPDLSTLSFDIPYWIEVSVGGTSLSPRQPLTSAPYALKAENLTSGDKTISGTLEVRGQAILGTTGSEYGVIGYGNTAIHGKGGEHGVWGLVSANNAEAVYGFADGGSGSYGVRGFATGADSYGVHGAAQGDGSYGIYGRATASGSYAGYFSGGRGVHISNVLRLEPRSSPPSNPAEGDIYVGRDGHIYCYLAGSWRQLDN